ncbi:GNAT family N-acetyltransferase [bacterium]|nr:GNAT family N-acetyltransferase [bacterium]
MPSQHSTIVYRHGGRELLDMIQPLWEELRGFHAELNPVFGPRILRRTFEERKQELLDKCEGGDLGIEIALDAKEGAPVGFLISTVNRRKEGELDFIYVLEMYRNQGIGGVLFKRGLEWLQRRDAHPIRLKVLQGNERVMSLYRRFGFEFRSYWMEQL